MKIAISAAETSGDLLGSKLVASLIQQNPNVEIEGLVGEKMQANGAQKLWHQNRVNVMGFSEVFKKLASLLRLRNAIIQYFSRHKPDVFIGIDAPDFNFFIEKKLKSEGIKTVHFVSPSVWAWRTSRLKNIKKSTDLVLCLFPFEVDFYQTHNQRAVFIGHPLADSLEPRKHHIKGKHILLMPGSRESEIKRLLPEMLSAVDILSTQDPQFEFHLALADDMLLGWVSAQIRHLPVDISVADAQVRMKQADLTLVASGTAALELALVGVPMVVVYKLSRLSYFIASKLINSQYISLPNVIANKPLVPELIQKQANGANIAQQAINIINSDIDTLTQEFNNIHQQLNLNASDESARIIYEFINE